VSEPVVVEFQHTLPTYLQVNAWHARRHGSGTGFSLVLCCALFALGTLALVTGTSLIWVWIAFVPASVLGLLTVAKPLVYRGLWRTMKHYHHPIRVEFGEDVIRLQAHGVQSELAWSFYVGWAESPTHLLLYQSKHAFSFVPKAALATDDTLEVLKEIFRSRYGPPR